MIKSKYINQDMARDSELTSGLALKYDASNPNGYETPTELNARDVAAKARGNHTGTQLASTISDLDSTVRGTLLSGLSTATNAAIAAVDNILTAMGKLQAQITGLVSSKYDASNPNSYETTTQLDARDTANRARANHTGTILSSVVSNFSSSVLAVVLTGLSVATSSAITAADSVLIALGKLQAQLNTIAVTVIPSGTGTANAAGTSTAYARADHAHNTVVTDTAVSATANTTTTSTTPVLMASMTITPIAGKYFVSGGTSAQSSANGAEIDLMIYSGGTLLTGSTRTIMPKTGNQDPATTPRGINTSGVVTVNGSQAIELRWNTTAGTATARERSMSILRIR